MKVMMHMHIKKNKKLLKRIIGIIVTAIVLMAAVVAIIFFNIIRKPQIKLVRAMTNTMESARESELNKKYGTYDISQNILKGSMNISYADIDSDGSQIYVSMKRSAEDHRFIVETGVDKRDFKLYVNQRTSIIYIGDKAIRIPYTDNLITNMSNSPVVSVLGIDKETVYAFGSAYESCMRAAASNYLDENGNAIDKDILEKTVQYFLNMEGSRERTEDITIGDKTQKCDIYSVVFNVEDFYAYLDDCFGSHSIDMDQVYNSIGRYIPQIDTIDNAADMVHDIKQFMDDIMNGQDITFYFAVNKKDELVRLYADDISDKKISVSLDFHGVDYIAQSYDLSIYDADGRKFTFVKNDISDEVRTGVSYSASVDMGGLIPDMTAGLEVSFEDDRADVTFNVGNSGFTRSAMVKDNVNGKRIDLAWEADADHGAGNIHAGCDPDGIDRPEYSESIDLFDTDILSAYKFIKDIYGDLQ